MIEVSMNPSRASSEMFADKLAALDLEPIVFKLVNPDDDAPWSVAKADQVAKEYRDFLMLAHLYPEKQIVPSKSVDKFWHTHILDTQKYLEDCQNLFGRVLHHFPYFGMRGEEDARNLQRAGEETRSLYRSHFGYTPTASFADCTTECGSSACQNQQCSDSGCNPSVTAIAQRPRLDRALLAH
jgi:hypothetical protein